MLSPMPVAIHTFTVNASHDARCGITGIGIVVQERRGPGRRGPIIAQLSEVRRDACSRSAELLAILRAFEIAIEKSWSHVQVRSDANPTRKWLQRMKRDEVPVSDPTRAKILDLAKRFVSVRFAYIPRRRNQLARQLARAARLSDPAYATSAPERHDDHMYLDPTSHECDEPPLDDVPGTNISFDDDTDEIPF
jgi:ribonuclease HI